MLNIYIDADACPVKDEVYRVADRYQLKVFVVSNQYLKIPNNNNVKLIVVTDYFDAADDWIVDQLEKNDLVITGDILLADRCIKKNARVLGLKGIEFTEDSIGSAVANRELMQNLRHMGEMRGGPSPLQKQDRSKFLDTLDQIIQSIRRNYPK